MTKKISRIIGILMFLAAAAFIIVALNNPQASFPWSNVITYGSYIVYIIVMMLFIIAPFGKRNQ